jgi:hypothetical protein
MLIETGSRFGKNGRTTRYFIVFHCVGTKVDSYVANPACNKIKPRKVSIEPYLLPFLLRPTFSSIPFSSLLPPLEPDLHGCSWTKKLQAWSWIKKAEKAGQNEINLQGSWKQQEKGTSKHFPPWQKTKSGFLHVGFVQEQKIWFLGLSMRNC